MTAERAASGDGLREAPFENGAHLARPSDGELGNPVRFTLGAVRRFGSATSTRRTQNERVDARRRHQITTALAAPGWDRRAGPREGLWTLGSWTLPTALRRREAAP